ncbi:MAG: glycosyltransferase family 4 protein [Anaerolineaceae bacterium]|nr:glycosyltransferase family 4 protein [Anaerolineaceae bacterium]
MTTNPKLFIASGIFHPESGGPATYLYELLPHLQAWGWDVRALTYGVGSVEAYPYPLRRIPRRALPLRMLNYARAARPTLAWADVVYLHTLGLPLVGNRRAPRILKIVGDQAWERSVRKGWIPPDTDIDTFQTTRYSLIVSAQQAARSREVRGMDGVIVPSEYLKRMVVGWGVAPEKVRVIYNALPPEEETPASGVSQAAARAALGLPDAPHILTAARLTPWKGIDHLITAISRLPDVRLLVAGDGETRPQLEAQAARLGVAERVDFLGRVPRDRMPLYMKSADYLALYSGYEGLSHTLLESLRVGTPVIASDKGGNPEVVRHGVNGLLVPYVDVDALTGVLQKAFQPGKRTALAANSQVGMERFDFSRMVEQVDATLRGYL